MGKKHFKFTDEDIEALMKPNQAKDSRADAVQPSAKEPQAPSSSAVPSPEPEVTGLGLCGASKSINRINRKTRKQIAENLSAETEEEQPAATGPLRCRNTHSPSFGVRSLERSAIQKWITKGTYIREVEGPDGWISLNDSEKIKGLGFTPGPNLPPRRRLLPRNPLIDRFIRESLRCQTS